MALSAPRRLPCVFGPHTFGGMSDVKIGLIGGTGIGEALGMGEGTRHQIDTPFGSPSGEIIETQWDGLAVFCLSRHGAGHLLNPTQVPFRANIFALKKLGVTHIITSGAVGSLREEFKPRDLVIPDQIIDKTSKRAGTFYEKSGGTTGTFAGIDIFGRIIDSGTTDLNQTRTSNPVNEITAVAGTPTWATPDAAGPGRGGPV